MSVIVYVFVYVFSPKKNIPVCLSVVMWRERLFDGQALNHNRQYFTST